MMSTGPASSVRPNSDAAATTPPRHARGVAAVEPAGPAVVYNLTVDEVHCYYAGGILVSNCEAGQYLMLGAGEANTVLRRSGDRVTFVAATDFSLWGRPDRNAASGQGHAGTFDPWRS